MIDVCYLVDAPYLGGAELYVSRLATGLDRSRFRARVIMRQPPDSNSGLDEWRGGLEDAGVPVAVFPMDIPWRPWRAVPIWRAIAEAAPHVVHVNLPGPQDGQMGLLVPVSRMAGTGGVVVTEHLPMIEPTRKRGLLKRISYHWVDRVATVCHANVRYLVNRQHVPLEKTVVIHNALDSSYGSAAGDSAALLQRFGLPADATRVTFLGNLLVHKGLHRVIEALSRIADRPWHLVVVGVGPEHDDCVRRLEHAGLRERATFLGRLSGEDVERVLAVSDVLTLPSTQEGMPYVILEAMASSVPVVSTAVYGIPEMVEHGETGLLVEPGDDGGLRDALERLIDAPEERNRLGSAARRRFEELFTLDRQLRRIESLYLDVARPGPRRFAGVSGGQG
jgi:glycosyltransferase involved in cell wall biosynthesis